MIVVPEGHMLLHSGRTIDIFDPRPTDIEITDIAHNLSNKCRFNGACNYHYSVAQHSVIVAEVAKRLFDNSQFTKAALMHDAAEAYMPDFVRPFKSRFNVADLEAFLLLVINTKFGILEWDREFMKVCDSTALAAECLELMPPFALNCSAVQYIADQIKIVRMTPDEAKDEFLRYYTTGVVDSSLYWK